MLQQARPLLRGWHGGVPFVKLWIDVERDGCPLRYESYRGDDLEMSTEISHVERFAVPGGRALWVPVSGTTSQYVGQNDRGALIHGKEPFYVETCGILTNSVKFNQGLGDDYFSVKKHALVANDEGLRKLQRELDQRPKPKLKKLPADPESRQKRLDEALQEADRQSQRLDASAAASNGFGWF